MYCATLVLFLRDTSATIICRWLSRCAGFSGTRSGCEITFGTIPDYAGLVAEVSNANVLFRYENGVPMRDGVGIDFKNDQEAIKHCKELAQHFRDGSLMDDQDLEISVVNSGGRAIHREFVHRE
jgi:Domain of unknown function (DUF6894)